MKEKKVREGEGASVFVSSSAHVKYTCNPNGGRDRLGVVCEGVPHRHSTTRNARVESVVRATINCRCLRHRSSANMSLKKLSLGFLTKQSDGRRLATKRHRARGERGQVARPPRPVCLPIRTRRLMPFESCMYDMVIDAVLLLFPIWVEKLCETKKLLRAERRGRGALL